MSFDMKQHLLTANQSVLGNYFSNRSHAIKEDLESFKAFLILLKYKYTDRVEIPRTVIKLLHMYHPQDGYEAYTKLLKIMCVLLEELDQDILKYLLSIIPPPNLHGSYDVKSMKDEVRGITGFDLLSTPAFHTWVLPVLKNTSDIKQKDLVAENKPTNSTELVQVQPKIDTKTEVLSAKNEDNVQNFENTLNVSSDSESIMSEPKFENCDLYEVVGDLSKTILNQLSSKPEYHKLSSPYKRMKNLFELEAMMAPSGSVDRTGYYENGEKKTVINVEDLAVEPVLEKSMKNFIARAYGLLPDVPSGEVRSNNEVKGKVDSNTKKKIDNCTKMKSTKQPKRKKSLLDELTRPQKKSLMSDLITPLDPITDNTETYINLFNTHGSKSDVNDVKKRTKSTLKKNVSSIMSSQAAGEVQIEPSVESKENIAPEIMEIETAIINTEIVNEKFKNVLPVTTISEERDKISIFTSHENMLRVTEKADFQTYDEKLYTHAHDKKVATKTYDAKLEVTTQHGKDDIQTNNNKDEKIHDERDKDNEDNKEIEEKHVVEIHSALTNQENDSNAGVFDFVGKDLEWNRENMKLFGINVTDEDICLSEPEIKVADENSDKKKPILPVPVVPDNSASEPVFHGFSLYKSHSSKEYLSYLHDLTVGKYTPQIKDQFPSLINEDKERSQIDEEKKPVSENNKNEFKANSVPNFESCVPSKLQSVNPPSRTWYDPQHPINMQMQRNPPVSFRSEPTRLRQYVHQGTPIHNVSGSALGNTSNPVSYESAYQTVPISQDWMIKATSTAQNVPYPSLGTYAYYAQNPTFRELAQQRARFAQRTAFLQAPPAVNNYMNSAHTLMMNGFWGSYPSVRPGVYARAGDIPAVMPGFPHAVYPMTDPMRQQQRLHAMLPNYVTPQLSTIQATPPPKNKKRKLEEIVGRLKETEKST